MDKNVLHLNFARLATVAGCTVLLMVQLVSAAAILEGQRMHPVQGKEGMVVTSHFLATQSAREVLKNGGNAIDAAVTAAFPWQLPNPAQAILAEAALC